ncbi:SIR2 family protein [Streptomyces canus]|uniref:P-loop NTPase n=1 Tax=Streptomyces canus TaxID=58343 RepID=UPI002E289D2A|nr:SIR2 family protein [Streptomyces canus]
MEPLDCGNTSDLQARIRRLIQDEDRSLITVFGSGISNAVLPDVNELTRLFREELPKSSRPDFDERVGSIAGTPLAYQNAASIVTLRAGEPAVMRAIRHAVLKACKDIPLEEVPDLISSESKCRQLSETGNWNVPPGYQKFADFLATLNGSVRGPIITTNFDPLIEIALRNAKIDAAPVPVTTNMTPNMEQLGEYTGLPVLHIHGYWTSKATSNTAARLTKERPALDGLLRALLKSSVVLVIGYSGWSDGFMKSLRVRILDEADLLDTEVLWAANSANFDSIANGVLHELVGAPGFNLYLGVDGHKLFEGIRQENNIPIEQPAPFGYSWVPANVSETSFSPVRFVEGKQPGWDDVKLGSWPLLSSARMLREELLHWMDLGGGGGAVAIGPLGEGKSMALRQIALEIREAHSGWVVLWREAGAPKISEQWLQRVRNDFGNTLICIDEADLVAADLVATKKVWSDAASGIVFLLASHDRLWWRNGFPLRDHIVDVLFDGITVEDAKNIGKAWVTSGIISQGDASAREAADQCADQLVTSAGAMTDQHNTLFGAVLDVRFGSDLRIRVHDLISKLSDVALRDGISVGDIFAGICLMQDLLDRHGSEARGASRPVIAAMVGLDSVFADGKILETLGREAAITFAGNRIYSRHPAISRAVVEYLRKENRMEGICKLVGRAGGRLRDAGASDEDGYRDAYLLAQRLRSAEATAAAHGAVQGAPQLLEPRVTLLSTLRKEEKSGSDISVRYAREVAKHLHDFRDTWKNIRAFLVEFSIVTRNEGNAQTSAGLAALALHDSTGASLDERRAGYALVSLAKASAQVRAQSSSNSMASVPELCYALLEFIKGPDHPREHLLTRNEQLLSEARKLSSDKMCSRLGPAVAKQARAAATEVEFETDLDGALLLNDLRRLAKKAHH